MATFILTILTLFLLTFLPKSETKFIEIKSISSENYLVVFDTGFFIYDNNLTSIKSLFNFTSSIVDLDNIIITKHIYKTNIYIFCLIQNYIYIYDDSKRKIFNYDIKSLVEDEEFINYKYGNIIPYNTEKDKMNLILSSLKNKQNWCYKKCHYDYIYMDYNIKLGEENLDIILNNTKTQQFIFSANLLENKNICHILDNFIKLLNVFIMIINISTIFNIILKLIH